MQRERSFLRMPQLCAKISPPWTSGRSVTVRRLGGRHIEHGLVFHRQLHRQIGRLLALKDAVDVGGGAASMAYLVRPI
jgi:hypothetical protein